MLLGKRGKSSKSGFKTGFIRLNEIGYKRKLTRF